MAFALQSFYTVLNWLNHQDVAGIGQRFHGRGFGGVREDIDYLNTSADSSNITLLTECVKRL